MWTSIILKTLRAAKRLWLEAIGTIFLSIAIQVILYKIAIYKTFQSGIFKSILSDVITFEGMIEVTKIIASSSITVATLVFSLTIISLMNIASNLSSRVVFKILNDKVVRITLGVYVAIFINSLIFIAQSSVGNENSYFILPFIYIIILLFIGLLSLIYYFQHIINSIQVDNICSYLSLEVKNLLEKAMQPINSSQHSGKMDRNFKMCKKQKVEAGTSGYINNIAYQELFDQCLAQDIGVDLSQENNNFIQDKSHLFTVHSSKTLCDEDIEKLVDCISIEKSKKNTDIVENKMMQITDIAMRSLSPGVNDTNSANIVIDYIGNIYKKIMEIGQPRTHYSDENGRLVLKIKPFSQSKFFYHSLGAIRVAAKNNQIALFYLLETLKNLESLSESKKYKEYLDQQIKVVVESLKKIDLLKDDKDYLKKVLE